jgi:ACS family hexuronate transporter-like MFS transporter
MALGTICSTPELMRKSKTWSIVGARFFIDPVWWMFVTWLPFFLKEKFSFDIKQIGAFAWVPYLFAALGGLAGGFFSSWLIKGGMHAVQARKRAILIGGILMMVSLAIIAWKLDDISDDSTLIIALISTTLFGFQFLINNLQTLPADYFHGHNVGTVAGIGGTAAVLGTLIVTWLVPIMTQTSYTWFFVYAATIVPLGIICLWMLDSSHKSKLA